MIDALTTRRIEFRVAVLRKGLTMYGVARQLGVSYDHLVLVLDGKRMPRKKLEEGIRRVMEP
jgi:hypothetical protein